MATIGVFLTTCLMFLPAGLCAVTVDSTNEDEVNLIRGDLETLKVFGLTRASVTNPEVADIVNYDENKILIVGKQSGQTDLIVWDKYGKRSIVIQVFDKDLNTVMSRLKRLLAESSIQGVSLEINQQESKVMASGNLSKDKKGEFDKLLEPFSASIMNLVKERQSDETVQIDAMIAELSSSYTKTLGIEWPSTLTYDETLPGSVIKNFGDIFDKGEFTRTSDLTATIHALITEGKGRILSKPKLVVISGKEASFLVGGQIPITNTTTSSGGSVSTDVTYKDYGVNLKIRPDVKENKRINLVLSLDVTDIDSSLNLGGTSGATGTTGGNNVAFITRNAQTELLLNNGQTVIIAGLFKQNQGRTYTRVPILSDVPIVGALFRKTSISPDTETELVISLTPTVMNQNGTLDSSQDFSVSTEEMPSSQNQAASSTESAMPKAFVPQDIAPYIQKIQQRIAQQIVYPDKARQYGWEGTVKLTLRILNDGTLIQAVVKEPSGYELFDDQALNIAKNLAPYASFPTESNLQELTVTVPIVYSLEK